MRYVFIQMFDQNEKEVLTDDDKIRRAKDRAMRELAKELMKKATVETIPDGDVKITIDV